jgi:RhtB (resistance to homoserine/threonine) family protein
MDFPWLEFLGLMLAWMIAAIIPGADFAMVLRQSITHGRRAALFTSAGIAAAVLVHSTYTLLGVGVIVSQSLLLFDILKWVGAGYLVWIGISALRSPPPSPPDLSERPAGRGGTDIGAFVLGFLTNLLNPKAILFFLALFTSLISASTPLGTRVLYVSILTPMLFVWFALVSLFFTMPQVRQGFFRLGRWFNAITGFTFILLALRVAAARQT